MQYKPNLNIDIFITENQIDAEIYRNGKRQVLPTAYCKRKVDQAKLNRYCTAEDSDDSFGSIADKESKLATQLEIQSKIFAMHNTFIDLSELEVNTIQDIIGDENDDEILITMMGTQFPVPFSSKIEFDPQTEEEQIHENSSIVCTPSDCLGIKENTITFSPPDKPMPVPSNMEIVKDNYIDVPLPICSSSGIESVSRTQDKNINDDSEIMCTLADCSELEFDTHIEEVHIREESAVEFLPPDEPMPVPFTSKMEYDDGNVTSFAVGNSNMKIVNNNSIDEIPNRDVHESANSHISSQEKTQSLFFSPPTSFAQPLLYGMFPPQNMFDSLVTSSTNVVEASERTQLGQTFNQSEVGSYLNIMHQHFEGKCFFVSFISSFTIIYCIVTYN